MLVRLLYVSRAVEPGNDDAIHAILASARQHNLHNGITGILCYGGGIFVQAIEGGRPGGHPRVSHIIVNPPPKNLGFVDKERE
jgi:hypothetical protein